MRIKVAVFDMNNEAAAESLDLLKNEATISFGGICSNFNECLKSVCQFEPDVLLITLPGGECEMYLEKIREARNLFPGTDILLQIHEKHKDDLFKMIVAGASGYIFKGDIVTDIVRTIQKLYLHGSVLDPADIRKALRVVQRNDYKNNTQPLKYGLTCREREILRSLVKGNSYKIIGFDLNISYETVRVHMKNIYQKLNVTSLTQVVIKALQNHIV